MIFDLCTCEQRPSEIKLKSTHVSEGGHLIMDEWSIRASIVVVSTSHFHYFRLVFLFPPSLESTTVIMVASDTAEDSDIEW
jgi:hypothetical protein